MTLGHFRQIEKQDLAVLQGAQRNRLLPFIDEGIPARHLTRIGRDPTARNDGVCQAPFGQGMVEL